jgi:predicted Zn-ribbon and HTH transcriptional regulator
VTLRTTPEEAKMRRKVQFTAKEEKRIAEEYDKEHKGHLFDPGECDSLPACICGWNGKVDWRVKGQRCPRCGLDLT